MSYTTKKSLLRKVRDGDQIHWTEFYQTYRPLIVLRGGDYGLDDEEKKVLYKGVKALNEFFNKMAERQA